jgi:hypothetical protein
MATSFFGLPRENISEWSFCEGIPDHKDHLNSEGMLTMATPFNIFFEKVGNLETVGKKHKNIL